MLNLNPYVWLAVLVALLGLYGAHRWVVTHEVKQAEAQLIVQLENKAKKTEDEIRLNALHLRNDKDAQLAKVNNDLLRANRLLASRPLRPQVLPATVGSACTGRELYQEDGLFLRGEAARAEALIIERDYYYNQYENVRKKLNEQ